MAKQTKYISQIDDRFSNYDGKFVFGNGSTPITHYSSTSPKFVQGVAYLQSNDNLKIDIRSNTSYEYDRVAHVIDHDYNSKIDFDYESEGKIVITYKNWTKRIASDKTLTLSFISGFRKTIVLKVPGKLSRLHDKVENTVALFTTSPYENMLSLDFSEGKRSNNTILGAVIPKKDPYDVFNYSGTYTVDLPFAYYANSSLLNEIFVEQGVISKTDDVDNGISNRGVGHLYSGPNEQEIHFVNLLGGSNLNTSKDVLNNLDSAPFTYGFVYASNLYFIADDAQEYEVCTDPGNPSFFLTSGNDCEGNSIGTPYTNKRFVNGYCCNSNCDGFSILLENTSPEGIDATNTSGKIKVTVTGGTANYTYVLTKYGVAGAGTEVSSGAVSSTTHEFTGLTKHYQETYAYKVVVTDSNSCTRTGYIRLQTKENTDVDTGECPDSNAANYNNTSLLTNDEKCFFCSEDDQYGNKYYGLTFGDGDSNETRPVGVDFVANDGSTVTHASAIGLSTGLIQFQGQLFPPLADFIAKDSDEAYKLKLYSLGNEKNANDKTKAEIFALTPTSTVTVDQNFQYSFTTAPGWFAIEAYIENVPNVANCRSLHRFYVGYGGCTDSNAYNFDSNASFHMQEYCKYNCEEKPVNIIVNNTNNQCVKSLTIARGAYDIINWTIGGERKQGFGPHLATEGDYVEVMVENTKSKCTQRGELHLRDTDCNEAPSAARSLIIQQTEGVGGCTDSNAANYDCDAEWDNGSCVAAIYGCTDVTAANYDPYANVDTGTCVYGIVGCTNPQAKNYDPLVNIADNDTCEFCEGLTGASSLGFTFSFDGALTATQVTDAIQAGTFDIYATGAATGQWTITPIQTGAYSQFIPADVSLNVYKLPQNDGTVNGYTPDQFEFPISEKMPDLIPAAIGKFTGLDSPNYGNSNFGTWNADGSLTPAGLITFQNQVLEGTLGYGPHLLEVKIPNGDGTFCYNYTQRNIPISGSADSDTGLGVTVYDAELGNAGFNNPNYLSANSDTIVSGVEGYTDVDNIGCLDPLASNYTGWGHGSRNLAYGIRNNPAQSPSQFQYYTMPNGWGYYVFMGGNPNGMCIYEGFDQPECIPKNIQQKQKYLTDCSYNGIGNWYTRLISGSKDNCEDRNVWVMSFIKYLLSKNGLDCIYNCSDSSTADYPKKKTCEEIWIEGGSVEWSMLNNTGQGNGTYGEGQYIKMTTQFPWLGENASNTIWRVNNNCGSECGNPYALGANNFDICIDPKIITETTNYLDKFYKFASDYCKSCSPCSFLAGNNNTVIGSNVNISEPFNYSSGYLDNGIQVGGIDISIDGEDLTTDDSI